MKVDNKEIQIHKVIGRTVHNMGIFRGYETHYVIDAPLDVFLEKGVAVQFDDEPPLYLRFEAATQTEIDGKLYTVLIRERFHHLENESKEND